MKRRRRGEGRKSSFCAKAVAVPLPPLFCLQQFSLGEADAREEDGGRKEEEDSEAKRRERVVERGKTFVSPSLQLNTAQLDFPFF